MFPAVGLLGSCINRAELCSGEGWSLVVKVRLAIFIFTPIHLLSIFFVVTFKTGC